MKTYEFDLVVPNGITEEDANKLFDQFEGRVTASIVSGVGYVSVNFDASSMDEALQDAIRRAEAIGLRVDRVELDPANLRAA